MQTTERQVGHVTFVDLHGAMTLDGSTGQLADTITSLLVSGRTSVVVNLAGVHYIDSEGLGQLVTCHSLLAKTGGRLKLLHVGTRHLRLLSITGLLSIFETFESEEEAIRSFPELLAESSPQS